jgi:hypothetical protein
MTAGRVLHAALHLLDRQLRDRDGRLCGKVDDLELSQDPDSGVIHVAAILSGPGTLLYRLGRRRSGRWLQRADAAIEPDGFAVTGRIPIDRVADIGFVVVLAASADELPSHRGERWARDHVIGHIPGGRRHADE